MVPFTKVRKLIAENMVRAKHTAAHTHCFDEADMSRDRGAQEGVGAAARGAGASSSPTCRSSSRRRCWRCKEFPWVNGEVKGETMVVKHYYNIGMAVGRDDKGLIVPNIKDCDRKNLVQLAAETNDLAARARNDRPQARRHHGRHVQHHQRRRLRARSTRRRSSTCPRWRSSACTRSSSARWCATAQIVARPMMNASIGFDHRVVDGELAVKFLRRVLRAARAARAALVLRMSTLSVAHLGPTTYRDGLALQEALVRARAEGRTGDWLLYPDHPPVLTVGRSGRDGSLKADPETLRKLGIEIFEVARGGDFTWHGPGQLVGLCDRRPHRARTRPASLPARPGIEPDCGAWASGAWKERPRRAGPGCGSKGEKIASIGVAVRRWVSYHGFALNVAPDLKLLRSHPSLRAARHPYDVGCISIGRLKLPAWIGPGRSWPAICRRGWDMRPCAGRPPRMPGGKPCRERRKPSRSGPRADQRDLSGRVF